MNCLSIGQVEVASVFHRKMREGAFDETAFREIAAQFAVDCAHGLWTWLPVTPALVTATVVAIGRLPRSVFLRSADALHLTCGREHGLTDLCTNDRHMSAAARHFGLRVLTSPPDKHRTTGGDRVKAQEHPATAATMYREMDMRFWLEQPEAERRASG